MTQHNDNTEIKYAGFRQRFYAFAIDTLLLLPIMYLLFPESLELRLPPDVEVLFSDLAAGSISGRDFLIKFSMVYLQQSGASNTDSTIQYVVMGIIVILFWVFRSATPGKMVLSMKIVDVKTFGKPHPFRLIIRYLGYILSSIPPFLGFLWIAIDKRKQGWHDKIAGTAVIYTKPVDSAEEKEKRFKRQTFIAIVTVLLFIILMRLI